MHGLPVIAYIWMKIDGQEIMITFDKEGLKVTKGEKLSEGLTPLEIKTTEWRFMKPSEVRDVTIGIREEDISKYHPSLQNSYTFVFEVLHRSRTIIGEKEICLEVFLSKVGSVIPETEPASEDSEEDEKEEEETKSNNGEDINPKENDENCEK